MESLISVIVPIYNVEKYLDKCVDSIIDQTYRNLEIILVDDGSPDNCGQICDEYAEKDNRIKVIHKENGGLSDARNAGLKISTGKYLVFVDSDDCMTTDGIEYLYKLAKKNNAQLVIGGTEKFIDETNEIIYTSSNQKLNEEVLNKEDAIKDFFLNGCASWARIYKREIHENIFFPIGEINEDEAIVLRLIERCTKIIKSNKIVYNYRYRPESITSSSFSLKKMDWYEHCKANLNFVKQKYPDLTEYAEKRYYSSIIFSLTSISFEKNKEPYKKILQELKSELKGEYRNILRNPYTSKREKIEAIILRNAGLTGYSCIIKTARAIKGALRKNVR